MLEKHLRTPSEAAICSPTTMHHLKLADYHKELIWSLSSARELCVAAASVWKAQKKVVTLFISVRRDLSSAMKCDSFNVHHVI